MRQCPSYFQASGSVFDFELAGGESGLDEGAGGGPVLPGEIDGEGEGAGVLRGAGDEGAGALLRGAADVAELEGGAGGIEPGFLEEHQHLLAERGEVASDGAAVCEAQDEEGEIGPVRLDGERKVGFVIAPLRRAAALRRGDDEGRPALLFQHEGLRGFLFLPCPCRARRVQRDGTGQRRGIAQAQVKLAAGGSELGGCGWCGYGLRCCGGEGEGQGEEECAHEGYGGLVGQSIRSAL